MKSVEKRTPPSTKVDRSQSGKKLIQARLPFKVISSTTSPSATAEIGATPPITKFLIGKEKSSSKKKDDKATSGNALSKKRKLSYSDDSDCRGPKKVPCKDIDGSDSKENNVVVVLSDDEDVGRNGKIGDEKVEPRLMGVSLNPFVRLESIDGMIEKLKNEGTGRIILEATTPKVLKKATSKINHTTPSTPKAENKFLIKLPFSGGKKKRKQLHKDDSCDSGSDLESIESNPQKKIKTDNESAIVKLNNDKSDHDNDDLSEQLAEKSCDKSSADEDNTHDSNQEQNTKNRREICSELNKKNASKDKVEAAQKKKDDKQVIELSDEEEENRADQNRSSDIKTVNAENESNDSSAEKSTSEQNNSETSRNNENSDKTANDNNEQVASDEIVSDKPPSEPNDASKQCTEETDEDELNNQSSASDDEKEKLPTSHDTSEDLQITSHSESKESKLSSAEKCTTPRPVRKSLKAESEKKRLERQKAKDEQELQKQREKEEKERQRKKEKEEKEEQRRKEREEKEEQRRKEKEEKEELRRKEKEEKEEQKRKEKEEKEKKRLAEIEAKNEERRKKEEAKEEERRKKEDEKRKKELEKEEAENKKKKAAEAFTKFFIAKPVSKHDRDRLSIDSDIQPTSTNFMPFRIKDHMKLAPIYRRRLTKEETKTLEVALESSKVEAKDNLYLNALKSGKITPGKDVRTLITEDDCSDDIVVIEDELKDAGLEIDNDKKIVQKFRAKYFLFHENVRPPYYGTWRKKSTIIGPRRPFATDKNTFDYEVDSDDEWEEEEPGESLEKESEDEKETDDEYEVDNEFFVPHGHLSDEELQNEDELDEDNSPETQKAKLKILQQEFAQEMKKKTEKIKPRLVGVMWADENGNQPELCPSVVWQSLTKRAMIFSEPIVLTEPEPSPHDTTPNAQKEKAKQAKLTENLVKDLIRLVHFNRHSKKFIIHEFKEYMAKKFGTDENLPNYTKACIQKKIMKLAKWKMVEDAVRKKKKLCWIVFPEMLKRYEMEDIGSKNTWKYTLQPRSHAIEPTTETEEEPAAGELGESADSKCKTPAVITKFTKVLSELEKAKQFEAIDKKNVGGDGADVTKGSTSNSKTATAGLKATPSGLKSKSSGPKSASVATKSSTPSKSSSAGSKSTTPLKVAEKKRVPLLISVPCGEKIPENEKNAAISKYLKEPKTDSAKSIASELQSTSQTTATATPNSKTANTIEKIIEVESSPEKQSTKSKSTSKDRTKNPTPSSKPPVKKRVPLLMSVPRGEKIPENKKNELISKFLQKDQTKSDDKSKHPNNKADKCSERKVVSNKAVVSKEEKNKNDDRVNSMDVDPPPEVIEID